MRVAKYFGETIRLPNDDWEALLDRLDPKNIVLEDNARAYAINELCPLCEKYQNVLGAGCGQCPFTVFRKQVGCIKLLYLLKPSALDTMSWDFNKIWWGVRDNKKVNNILKDLRKHLFRMEKI